MSIKLSSKNFIPRKDRTSKVRGIRKPGKWISKKVRWAIYALDGYRCRSCGKRHIDMTGTEVLTLDHLACWSNWGSNKPANLITLCRSCNSSRHHMDLNTWLNSLDSDLRIRLSAEIAERVKLSNKSNIKSFRRQISAAAFWIAEGSDKSELPSRL